MQQCAAHGGFTSSHGLVTRALLTGEEAVGALVWWVLGGHSVLPVLPLVLLGLGFGLDLWGSSGDVFCPSPSVGVVGHHR